jgi:hypothetical protein
MDIVIPKRKEITLSQWERDFNTLIFRAKHGRLSCDEECELAEVAEGLWKRLKKRTVF